MVIGLPYTAGMTMNMDIQNKLLILPKKLRRLSYLDYPYQLIENYRIEGALVL